MTNSAALRERIKRSGFKLGYIAEKIGITAYTLQKKIDNETEFKVSEVDCLAKLLNLTALEKDAYFFAAK